MSFTTETVQSDEINSIQNFFEDFDTEQEFIEENLSKLNKELLNTYVSVIERDFKILINNLYKYQYFLETFYDYQLYKQLSIHYYCELVKVYRIF